MRHPDEHTQSLRSFLDHGTEADTATEYPDGSRREPRYNPNAEEAEKSRRPLAPSPFAPKRGAK